jgi:hypothetical protein
LGFWKVFLGFLESRFWKIVFGKIVSGKIVSGKIVSAKIVFRKVGFRKSVFGFFGKSFWDFWKIVFREVVFGKSFFGKARGRWFFIGYVYKALAAFRSRSETGIGRTGKVVFGKIVFVGIVFVGIVFRGVGFRKSVFGFLESRFGVFGKSFLENRFCKIVFVGKGI